MPFVRVNDLVVHYDFAGPGGAPVIAIGNSLGTSFHMWDDNIAALSERYRVLRHDMRGHGLTSASADPARTSIDILTDDLVGLLDVLGINRVRYVGLSIGGVVAAVLCMLAYGSVGSFGSVLSIASMASKTASLPATRPSRVAAIHLSAGWNTLL